MFQKESKTNDQTRNITVELVGIRKNLIKAIQLLAWFGTVFRSSANRRVALSTFKISQVTSFNCFRLKLLKLEQIDEASGSCWHPLFQGGVVASGFPIQDRNGESGIELPLEVMIELAGVMGPVAYKGGIVLKGFSSILFPCKMPSMLAGKDIISMQ